MHKLAKYDWNYVNTVGRIFHIGFRLKNAINSQCVMFMWYGGQANTEKSDGEKK